MPDIPKSDEKQLAPADKQRSVAPRSILASRGLELALDVRQEKERMGYDNEGVRCLYDLANEQDDADAQYVLGRLYEEGGGFSGVPQDAAEAVRWYRRAAKQGLADAQYALGICYVNGEGVPKDDGEAAYWYRQAAEQDHAGAQFMLGVLYEEGDGVPQDAAEAVRWYRRAAEQGDADAQYNLGVSYANGEGVPQDDVEAARWFRLSAEQGDADAQFMLGDAYAEGRGVTQDSGEAVRRCWQAAQQGHAYAQFHLGYFYADFPRCRFCEKLIGEVVAATDNPTKDPHGKGGRPFHCSCRQCYHTQNEKTVNCYWKTYPNPEEAKKAGHERSCSTCIS